MKLSLTDIFGGLHVDPFMSALAGWPVYDLFQVDARLHEIVGDYERDGRSMKEVVEASLSPEDVAEFRRLVWIDDA